MTLSYHSTQKPTAHPEQGSALVWIFVMIVLFAALNATVGQMMREGNQGADRELKQMYISEILQYSDSMRRAVRAMQINGIRPEMIDFDNNDLADYDNPACTNNNCLVFNPAGGARIYQAPDPEWLDLTYGSETDYGEWFFPADSCVPHYPGEDAGTCDSDGVDNEDLIMMLPYIKKDLCMALNDKIGITNPADDAPASGTCHDGGTKFIGSFSDGGMVDHANFHGAPTGCFKQTAACGAASGGYYVFYKVLAGR